MGQFFVVLVPLSEAEPWMASQVGRAVTAMSHCEGR